MTASKILGIIGICISWTSIVLADTQTIAFLIGLIAIILGIVGLSVEKEKGKEKRDKTLNIISIILGILFYVLFLNWYRFYG